MLITPTSCGCPDREPPNRRKNELERCIEETMVGRGISDSRVLDAIRRVPRHEFVPPALRDAAYDDRPLPIGLGQTISQPYIVALMTEAASPQSNDRCLEIGTGCGYQTAVLSLICREVYSIEYMAELSAQAQHNLESVGLFGSDLHLKCGDGCLGWLEAAPFNVILVTAAPPSVPAQLLEQLAPGGRLIIPVGPEHGTQHLERWTSAKDEPGSYCVENLLDVRFVPMAGAIRNAREACSRSMP